MSDGLAVAISAAQLGKSSNTEWLNSLQSISKFSSIQIQTCCILHTLHFVFLSGEMHYWHRYFRVHTGDLWGGQESCFLTPYCGKPESLPLKCPPKLFSCWKHKKKSAVFLATESTFGSYNEPLSSTCEKAWLEFTKHLSYVSFTQSLLFKQNTKKKVAQNNFPLWKTLFSWKRE